LPFLSVKMPTNVDGKNLAEVVQVVFEKFVG
jgi:hypothetical protein